MQSFDVFKNSVIGIREQIEQAREIDYRDMKDADWKLVKEIFRNIRVMASGSRLVGNSKAMAHMVPNIVPPIDRKHTLRYLKGSTNIKNGIDFEWNLMREIIENFFIPVAKNEEFILKAKNWMANQSQFPWDTSLFKVIDNLIMAAAGFGRPKQKMS